MKPQRGDVLELEVSKVVHGGYGLARHEGYVVFAKGALPGEVVTARMADAKKSHGYADVLAVLSPSAHRVQHVWPEADVTRAPELRAGGADYGHIDIAFQRELKTEILRDALVRFGRVDASLVQISEVRAIPGDDSGMNWRTRVSLHVDDEGSAGPYAEGSHKVIPVNTLPLATDAINSLGAHRMQWSGHQRIRIVDNSRDSLRLVIDTQKPEPITQWVGEVPFRLSDQSFWQVHYGAAKTLFDEVANQLSSISIDARAEHWDLYGGVGLFSRAISHAARGPVKVTTVEGDKESSRFAAENLVDVDGAHVVNSDVQKFVLHRLSTRRGTSRSLGVVILDPPRSGAGKKVIRALCALHPKTVVYVACDAVALSRDLAEFTKSGYRVLHLAGLDLFPHTHHFESLAILQNDEP